VVELTLRGPIWHDGWVTLLQGLPVGWTASYLWRLFSSTLLFLLTCQSTWIVVWCWSVLSLCVYRFIVTGNGVLWCLTNLFLATSSPSVCLLRCFCCCSWFSVEFDTLLNTRFWVDIIIIMRQLLLTCSSKQSYYKSARANNDDMITHLQFKQKCFQCSLEWVSCDEPPGNHSENIHWGECK